jgi:uncharacterized protein
MKGEKPMRRKEFSISESKEIAEFLAEMSFGFLGTVGEDGWPHVIPLNFVYYGENIYFHGSKKGQKVCDLMNNPQVTFSVAKEYAVIPSYFSDPKLACPATAFFKSVMVRGTASIVEDIGEKAEVFTAFMSKLQPEGGYMPFDLNDPDYVRNLSGVLLVKIAVEDISAKFKFGQNLKEERFEQIASGLTQRQKALDGETIDFMRKYHK